ncbi:MAG: hypothetical protein CENE_01513 [Candidatus Celerinatantimonas neptuna]|nr:MAG: hypothetical protein CENE_01513 [Candidatus Celerinatantimonas neptuna]
MTADGFHSDDGHGIALWVIWDLFGNYGADLEWFKNIFEKDIYQAVQKALARALLNTGRPSELPELIWLHSSLGCEERVIAVIENMVGKQVPIAGGSAVGQRIQGDWSLFNQDSVAT